MSATISTPTTIATANLITAPTTTETLVKQGWHPDPRREHEMRWHDGEAWTENVTHFGPVPCRGCNPGRN